MMKVTAVFSLLFLAVAQCATVPLDPTKVCMPNTFMSAYYDAKTQNTTYTIEKDDTCTKKPLTPSAKQSVFQCLPPGAKPATINPIRFGSGDKSMMIQSWDIDYGQGNHVRYAFNTDKPAIPVLRQAVGDQEDLGMFVYVNPTDKVDPELLKIPASCPKSTKLFF